MSDATRLNPNPFPDTTGLALELFYQNTPISITPQDTPFLIGRENPEAGLSVAGDFASRAHCCIEYHDGRFLLKDFSRNGTFLKLGSSQTIRLKDEAMALVGSGGFKLGAEMQAYDPERILFKIITDHP